MVQFTTMFHKKKRDYSMVLAEQSQREHTRAAGGSGRFFLAYAADDHRRGERGGVTERCLEIIGGERGD